MSSSSFSCNWVKVVYVLKNIGSVINYKESKCDLYTTDYISISPIDCSKGLLGCVLNCTNFPEKKCNWYMFKINCSSLEHWYKKLGACFNKQKGKKSSYSSFLTMNSYPRQNNWKLALNIYFFRSNMSTCKLIQWKIFFLNKGW